MNEGLIQLLVVAAIIIFSIMDGAARKRRKEAQSLGHLPTTDGFPEAADDVDAGNKHRQCRDPHDRIIHRTNLKQGADDDDA